MASAQDLSLVVNAISSFRVATDPPTKVTQFTRPTSSHVDPLTQFTYGKAKLPQMDFTRKTAQNPPAEPTLSRLAAAKAADTPVLPVMSENLNPGSENAENKGPQGLITNSESPVADAPIKDVAHPNDDQTPMESHAMLVAADAPSGLTSIILDSDDDNVCPPTKLIKPASVSVDQQRELSQRLHRPQIKTKPMTHERQGSTGSHPSPCESQSYGDILENLLLRFKDDQEKQRRLEASQHAKDNEIQDLTVISHTLYDQLQIAEGRAKVQQRELSEYHTIKLQWERRIESLNKSINDFVADCRRLQDKAKNTSKQRDDIQDQSLPNNANEIPKQRFSAQDQSLRSTSEEPLQQKVDIQWEIASLEVALKDLHSIVKQERFNTDRTLLKAFHEMERLEQVVENQERQLRQDADCLKSERERTQQLENMLPKITINYEELTRLLTGHRDSIIQTLSDQAGKSDTEMISSSQPTDDLAPVLDQCFGILQELQKVKRVKPQHLSTLNENLNFQAERLIKLMQSCESTSVATSQGQQQIFIELKRQFTNLNDNINIKHNQDEQIMSLREVQATMRERLKATETSLVEARQHAAALENQEKSHSQRILEMESEAVKLQSKWSEVTQFSLQLEESKACNRSLEEQIANLRIESLSTSEQLQQKGDDVTHLRVQLTEVQSQLAEAHAEMAKFEGQKLAHESLASEQSESLRKQLSHDTKLELARLESKHSNDMKQLRQQKIITDAKAQQQRVDAEAKIGQLKNQVEKLQAEKTTSQWFSPKEASGESLVSQVEKHASPAVIDISSQGSQSIGRPNLTPRQPGKSILRTTHSEFTATILSEKRSLPAGAVDGPALKRPRKLVSQGLGPIVISTSQSPNRSGVPPSRGNRKLSTSMGKKTLKEDKYTRRFSQELEME